jgi:outer membrane lipoprotein-sorting protein
MKKLTLLFLSLFIISGLNLSAQDPGIDEILANYFETLGQKYILEVQTVTMTGKILQGGMELPFKIIQKRPGKFYLEAEVQGTKMQQAVDGETGWMLFPGSGSLVPNDITGPQLKAMKEQADIDGYLWKWKEMGFQLELLGTEDLEGSTVYNLRLTKEDGAVDNYYIDKDNFVCLKLKNKLVIQGSEMEQESVFSNFKQVNGILQPYNLEQRMNGQTVATLVIDEIKYDEVVSDTLFVKPVVTQ